MAAGEHSGGLGDLLSGLASDISGLFRKEIQLAKAEASEKLDVALGAGRNVAIGAVLAIGAIGVFLAALVADGCKEEGDIRVASLKFEGVSQVSKSALANALSGVFTS